jgi:hypothetical protein
MKFVDSVISPDKIHLVWSEKPKTPLDNKHLTGRGKFPFLDFLAILICFSIVLGFFNLWVKANSSAKVQFTTDTTLSLSGISDGDLYIAQDSECDSLSVSGSTLTVDIPNASTFTLGTATHNVLRLTPSGGTVTLTFSSNYFSSGYASQWTAGSSVTSAQVSFLVGVSEAWADYLVRVDGSNLGYFQSSGDREVTFTYSGGFFSQKIFEIRREDRPTTGGGLLPEAYNPPTQPTEGFEIFINNDAEETDSRNVNLALRGGPNTRVVWISENPNFPEGYQVSYNPSLAQVSVSFTLSKGEGTKTVYAKFCTQWGRCSEVVSDSIILKTTAAGEEAVPEIGKKVPEIIKKTPEVFKPKPPEEIKLPIKPPEEIKLPEAPVTAIEKIKISFQRALRVSIEFIKSLWQRIWPF